MPDGVGAHREHEGDEHDAAARHAARGERHRKGQIAALLEPGRFELEAPHRLVAVEPERVGVSAHEAQRIDRAGQAVVAGLFDGGEIGRANAQRAGDLLDRDALLLAGAAQQIADRVARPHERSVGGAVLGRRRNEIRHRGAVPECSASAGLVPMRPPKHKF